VSEPSTDASTASADPNRSRLTLFLPILIDLVAPVAIYYLLRAAGASELLAVCIGALAPAGNIVYGLVRGKKVDKLAVFVLVLAAVGIAVSVIGGSAKAVLARESAFTGVAGIWCLATLVRGKPLTYFSVRPFVVRGNVQRDRAWDRAWEVSPTFRSILKAIAAAWGIMFVIDSAARLVVVYLLNVDQAAFAVQLPGIVLFLGVIIFTRRSGGRLRALLDEQVPVAGSAR